MKYEMAAKSGRSGSLLKDLKSLRLDQKSRTNTALKEADGKVTIVKTWDIAERWRQHFEAVLNMQTTVSEVTLDSLKECDRGC